MLVPGLLLSDDQRRQVLAAYTNRWTEECAIQHWYDQCPACCQHFRTRSLVGTTAEWAWHQRHVPLMTDKEWLTEYCFRFTGDGRRLKNGACVPAKLAYGTKKT